MAEILDNEPDQTTSGKNPAACPAPTHDAAANLVRQIRTQKQALDEILGKLQPTEPWLQVWRHSLDRRKAETEEWKHEDAAYWCLFELVAWAEKYAKDAA